MITPDTRSESEPTEDVRESGASGDAARPPGTRYSYLIALLGRLEGTVTIDRVADAVHRWERDTVGADGERTWYDIHDELFRVDLPVLDRAGIVTFDRARGLVSEPGASPGPDVSPTDDRDEPGRAESAGRPQRSEKS